MKTKDTQRLCLHCGDSFTPKQADSRFCSTRCHKAFYQQNYDAAKRGTTCEYNEAVICSTRSCATCGWNPSVASARLVAHILKHNNNRGKKVGR